MHRHYPARAATLLVVLTIGALFAGEPRMIAAIDALRRTKTSVDPTKELQIAAENLRLASKNKAGYRGEALQIVEKLLATKPPKIDFDRMVDDAITKCEKGAAAGFKPIGHHG